MNFNKLKSGWEIVKFGDVVKNANLVERDIEGSRIDRIVGLEHIDSANLHIRRWNNPENGTSFTRKFVPGQTLFGKRRAYQRKVAFAEFEGICSGDILTFETKDSKVLFPELIPFICQTDAFFDYALGTSAGSLSPRTSWKALKEFKFLLPPLDEQKRIAEILWAVDEVAKHYSELKQKVEKTFSVLLARKFPKYKDDPNLFVSLASICAKLPQSGLYKGEEFLGHGLKIVKMGQLFGNELIDDSIDMERMELTNSEIEKYKLTSNDLLFGRRSIVLEGAGKCSMVGELNNPIVFESSILRVSLDPAKAKNSYVYCWLNSPEGMQELHRIRSFTTVAGITGSDLKKAKVPLLSRSKQDEIVQLLENYRTEVVKVERHYETILDMLKSIRENLAGGATHV